MHARRCVVSANSARSYRDSSLSPSSHSSEKGRRRVRQDSNYSDDETSTRSDGSLGTVVPVSRRYAQVGVTPSTYRECGTTTTRRLHVAFDNKHQIWHLVSPEALFVSGEKRGTSSHQAEDDNSVTPDQTDTTAEFTPAQSRGSGERRQSSESSQRDTEGSRSKDDMPMTPAILDGVLNAVPSKSNSAKIHGQPENVKNRDLTRPEKEAGNERSLTHGKKRNILYACGVTGKAVAVVEGGHTTWTKQDAGGVMLYAVDGPQRQHESSDKSHEGTRERNLVAIGGKGRIKEQSDVGDGDGAVNPVSLSDRCGRDVGETWLGRQASVGFSAGRWGSAISESSEKGMVRMASGSLPYPSSERLRATWRGDAVNLDETIVITLKETKIGQPRSEENNVRVQSRSNPDRKGFLCKKSCWDSADEKFSYSEALDGCCDSAKFSSSEALDRPAASRDDASGLRAAGRGAEGDTGREKGYVDPCSRRGSVSKRDRSPRTRNIVLTENEALPVFLSQRAKSPANARVCASGITRGETRSHAFPLPLYFLPEPYIGPPIADFPRTWPSGARLFAESSEPKFGGETRNTDGRRGRMRESRLSGREMRSHRSERSTSSERCSRAGADSDNHGDQSEVKNEARGEGSGAKGK